MRRILSLAWICCLLPGVALAQDPRIVAMAHGVHLTRAQMPALVVQQGQDYAGLLAAAKALSVPAGGASSVASAAPTPSLRTTVPSDGMMEITNRIHPNRLGTPELPDDLRGLMPQGLPTTAQEQMPSPLTTSPSAELLANSDGEACGRYMPEAEHRFGIPNGILRAINMVESGGWPWTLNVGGSAVYGQTKEQAMAHMGDGRGYMRQDVAVGCMQLYVRYHGQRFQDAAHMLDPRTNVMYAAYYLRNLYAQFGSWQDAVARYHSSQQSYQRVYLCSVVKRRIQFGYQRVNTWYADTCEGGRGAATMVADAHSR